jgi:hypothetical protein
MSLGKIVRKILLCCLFGGHAVLRVGVSKEQIEDILHAMHQTKVEVTISEKERGTPHDESRPPAVTG